MIEFLESIGRVIRIILRILEVVFHVLLFIAGLKWIFSKKYREEVRGQNWHSRWFVYDGVLEVAVVAGFVLLVVFSALFPILPK